MRIRWLVALMGVGFAGAAAFSTEATMGGSSPMVGGWRDITNSNDANLDSVEQWVYKRLEAAENDNEEHRYTTEMAKVQVVAGLKYRLVIVDRTPDSCEKHYVEVWDKPWEKSGRKVLSQQTTPC